MVLLSRRIHTYALVTAITLYDPDVQVEESNSDARSPQIPMAENLAGLSCYIRVLIGVYVQRVAVYHQCNHCPDDQIVYEGVHRMSDFPPQYTTILSLRSSPARRPAVQFSISSVRSTSSETSRYPSVSGISLEEQHNRELSQFLV